VPHREACPGGPVAVYPRSRHASVAILLLAPGPARPSGSLVRLSLRDSARALALVGWAPGCHSSFVLNVLTEPIQAFGRGRAGNDSCVWGSLGAACTNVIEILIFTFIIEGFNFALWHYACLVASRRVRNVTFFECFCTAFLGVPWLLSWLFPGLWVWSAR
jgi:hypothetical protein